MVMLLAGGDYQCAWNAVQRQFSCNKTDFCITLCVVTFSFELPAIQVECLSLKWEIFCQMNNCFFCHVEPQSYW